MAVASCAGQGECDSDAFMQLKHKGLFERRLHGGQGGVAPSDKVLFGPVEFSRNNKDDGGTFVVYNFTLAFDDYRSYWRRFGVDLPSAEAMKSCPGGVCPVLLDFPGSGGTVYSQRNWTRWYKYQASAPHPFILVTVEGSPDAVMPPGTDKEDVLPCTNVTCPRNYVNHGGTSWNVLGWGDMTKPIPVDGSAREPGDGDVSPRREDKHGNPFDLPDDDDEAETEPLVLEQDVEASGARGDTSVESESGGCKQLPTAACFEPATYAWNSYQCFGTHLAKDPNNCVNVKAVKSAMYTQIPNKMCASASGANDWDYLKSVLYYVTSSSLCSGWCGNKDRIYFHGQSMGGMASIQFAVPQQQSRYNMGPFSPKAIAACSASGSRSNKVNLTGSVPTLLLQGFRDNIAPGTVWAGFNRGDPGRDYRESYLPIGSKFEALRNDDRLVMSAIRTMGRNDDVPNSKQTGKRTNLLLNADIQTGGDFLSKYTQRLVGKAETGCADGFSQAPTAIGYDSYMWETFGTTLGRVAGTAVDMTRLYFQPPPGFHPEAANRTTLYCANATRTAGSRAEIQACTFHGGHTWPWLKSGSANNQVNDPDALHKFVWEWWFKGGTRV